MSGACAPVFNSPTGMPYRFVNLKTGKTSGAQSNPAEIGTLLGVTKQTIHRKYRRVG